MSWSSRSAIAAGRTFAGGKMPSIANKLYFVGGMTSGSIDGVNARSNRCDQYDPVSNTWTAKANLPTYYIAGHAVAADGTYLWVVNGVIDTTSSSTSGSWNTDKAFRYDPVGNSWSTTTGLGTSSETRVMGEIIGNNFYVVTKDAILEYTISGTSISFTTSYVPTGFETTYDSVCAANGDGKLYIIFKSGNHKVFDPGSPTILTSKAAAPYGWAEQFTPTYTGAGFNYLMGGTNGTSGSHEYELYEYDPIGDAWTQLTNDSDQFTAAVAGLDLTTPSLVVAGGNYYVGYAYFGPQALVDAWDLPSVTGTMSWTAGGHVYIGPEGTLEFDAAGSLSIDGTAIFVKTITVGIHSVGTSQSPIPMPIPYPDTTLYPLTNLYPRT